MIARRRRGDKSPDSCHGREGTLSGGDLALPQPSVGRRPVTRLCARVCARFRETQFFRRQGPIRMEESQMSQSRMFGPWKRRCRELRQPRFLPNEIRETPSISVRRVRKDVLVDERHTLLPSPASARDVRHRRCCTNRDWPARCPPTGSSPVEAIRHGSAEGGHPIEDRTAEDDLTPLPGWAPGPEAISDNGRVSEARVLHPALTMVP